MADDFLHRPLPYVGKTAFRLGLACNYGIDAAGLQLALERGVNYVYWTTLRTARLKPTLKAALKANREGMILACGPTLGFYGGGVRSGCEATLRDLGIDHIDVFLLQWLGVTSAYTDGTVEELQKLKQEGKIRAIGTSIHDRERAGRMAEDSAIELFMLRYNAAHPGAERDIFPHLAKRNPGVVAYTATAWKKLLTAPTGWSGPTMTAGDCYRFCLSNPHVHLCLSGPGDAAQLTANLDALAKGPLTAEEETWMRAYGKAAHG
jgi:aryl-alcohol dehydrogenase-like predicted oxidoreductase